MRHVTCVHCGFAAGVHALRCAEFAALLSGDAPPVRTPPKADRARRQRQPLSRIEADRVILALFG